MKTQVFKNSETTAASNLLMIAAMIILSGILLFAINNRQPVLSDSVFNKQWKQETETHLLNPAVSQEAAPNKTETTENTASETEFSMIKMHEFLIPENEPELTLELANSITFPKVTTEIFSIEKNIAISDNFLKDLKNQANEKTREAVELYALERRVRDFLTVETEKPLCMEDWMVSEKCWCPELHEKMAFNQEK